MSKILDMFDKLDDIIYEPIKLFTDWAREPLKRAEHKRDLDADLQRAKSQSDNAEREEKSRLEAEAILSDVRVKEKKSYADILNGEAQVKSEIESNQLRLESELSAQRERLSIELDQFKKDSEEARFQRVTEAIAIYKEKLTNLNIKSISSLGNMQLELRAKAQNLVHEKTIKYKELQDGAHTQAQEEIIRIERDFGTNDRAKDILYKSVDSRLANIINTAQNFLVELNNDIAQLNNSIGQLTDRGQSFIENHLGRVYDMSDDGFSAPKISDSKIIEINHKD